MEQQLNSTDRVLISEKCINGDCVKCRAYICTHQCHYDRFESGKSWYFTDQGTEEKRNEGHDRVSEGSKRS